MINVLKGSRQKEASRGRCCGEIDLCLYVQIFFFNYQNNPLLLTAHSQIAKHLTEETFALWKIYCHSYL